MTEKPPWPAVPFAEVATIAEGQVDPRVEPYLSMIHVGPEDVESETGRLLARRTAREVGLISGKYLFGPGDVVYSKIRPYLRKSILADCEGVCSADMYPLSARANVDPGFLHKYTLSRVFTDQATAEQARTGIPKINRQQLNRILVRLPPLVEQQAIAKVLSRVQASVEVHEQAVAKLRELKAATMAKVFREGLRGERLKETEIGEVPESWRISSLQSIAELATTSQSFSAVQKAQTIAGDVGEAFALKVSDMNRPGNETHLRTATINLSLPANYLRTWAVPAGAIVMPKRGAAISTNKKRLTEKPAFLDPNLIAVVPQAGCDTGYLFQWFQRFDLSSLQEPGTVPQLNKKDLAPLQVPVPSLNDQQEIGRFLASVDKYTGVAVSELKCRRSLFAALLNALMAGQLRLQ